MLLCLAVTVRLCGQCGRRTRVHRMMRRGLPSAGGVFPQARVSWAGALMEGKWYMIDLFKFGNSPFEDKQISLNNLIDYSGTHLQRMVSNNPGQLLNQRITATSTVLLALDNTMSDNQAKLALRMARVQAKDAFRAALPENLARIHGAVVAAFGSQSTQLTECFPQGRTPFFTCRDDRLDDLLQALQTCLVPLAAQVGQSHVDNLGGLISTWIALLGAVDSAASIKNNSETARRTARTALQLELFKNLLTVALAFPNDEAKITLYCPQHLLENHPGADLPGVAAISINAFDPESRQVTFHLAAAGALAFTLQRRGAGGAAFTDVATALEAADGSAIYMDTLAEPGQYEYRALGTNAAGPGPVSAPVTVEVTVAAAA